MSSQEKPAPLTFPDRVKIARFIEERVEILQDAPDPADRLLRYKDGLTDGKIAKLYGTPGLNAGQVTFIRASVVGRMLRGGPRPQPRRANLTARVETLTEIINGMTETINAHEALMETLESDLSAANERCRVIAAKVIEIFRRLEDVNPDLMLPDDEGWRRWDSCDLPIDELPNRLRSDRPRR